MEVTVNEFLSIQGEMSARDNEIERLSAWVINLKREAEKWKTLALSIHSEKAVECSDFIVIPIQKLKKVVSGIQDVQLLGSLSMLLQKCLPDNAPPEECKMIADIIPLPQRPALSLQNVGDVHIDGDVNTENHFEPGSKSQVFNGNVNGNFERE